MNKNFRSGFFIKNILGIKEDKLFLTILKFSKELRDFCDFTKLPDATQLSRFKTKFCDNIAQLFENLVDITAAPKSGASLYALKQAVDNKTAGKRYTLNDQTKLLLSDICYFLDRQFPCQDDAFKSQCFKTQNILS